MRAKTDSFIAEFPLRTSASDERVLSVRLDAARQIYNAVLGECLRVLALMRESKEWSRALSMPKSRERTVLFRAVRDRFDFKSSMADRFAILCASGVGFPHPHALRRVRAGRPSKRGENGREAGDVVAARRGLRRATDVMMEPHHLLLSEPPGFIPGEG
jgi:hypothetical protein